MSTYDQERARQQRTKHARQRQVAALRLVGVRDQQTIAQALGVSKATISRDCAELDARYQQEAAQDIQTAKGLDLERLDALLTVLWPDAMKGRLGAVDRVLALLERRAKMLGLDAPAKIDIELHVRQMAASMGLDPDAAVEEAQRLLRELRQGRVKPSDATGGDL